MLWNHGSQEGTVRAFAVLGQSARSLLFGIANTWEFCDQVHFNYDLLGVASEGEQAFRSANGHIVIKPSTTMRCWRQGSARRPAASDQRRHPW